jgi:putative MATE family efflux protein
MENSVETGTVTSDIKPASRLSSLWSDVRESIKGSEQDFTEGRIGRAILLLSIPMVLEMSMESLLGIVDVFIVAQLGADAIATVGLTESLLTLVFGIAMGLAMSTTAMVARRIGEKDSSGAAKAAVQSLVLGILVSIPIGVVAIFYAPQLFALMGASDSIIRDGSIYGAIVIGSNVVIILLFLINAVFRGAGDAAIAMRALWISNLLNMAIDPCLVFGLGPFPEMGLEGAAWGTFIGRGAGVVYQLFILFSGRGRVVIHRSEWRIDFGVMWNLLKVSLGGIFQFLIATASWLALVRIVAIFGSAAIAGYTIALRIIIVALLPSWGIGNAAATLVGQNLGAGKPDRAERSVWVTGFVNMVFLGIVTVIFIAFAEPLVRIFSDDEQVVSYGISCLRFISYGYVFYAYGMVVVQAFNGAGDTFTPTVINIICYWLIQIPMAYWMAMKSGLGANGLFLAITIAESLLAVVAIIAFRRGRWKEQKI